MKNDVRAKPFSSCKNEKYFASNASSVFVPCKKEVKLMRFLWSWKKCSGYLLYKKKRINENLHRPHIFPDNLEATKLYRKILSMYYKVIISKRPMWSQLQTSNLASDIFRCSIEKMLWKDLSVVLVFSNNAKKKKKRCTVVTLDHLLIIIVSSCRASSLCQWETSFTRRGSEDMRLSITAMQNHATGNCALHNLTFEFRT